VPEIGHLRWANIRRIVMGLSGLGRWCAVKREGVGVLKTRSRIVCERVQTLKRLVEIENKQRKAHS